MGGQRLLLVKAGRDPFGHSLHPCPHFRNVLTFLLVDSNRILIDVFYRFLVCATAGYFDQRLFTGGKRPRCQ